MANEYERVLILVWICKQKTWGKSYDFNEDDQAK